MSRMMTWTMTDRVGDIDAVKILRIVDRFVALLTDSKDRFCFLNDHLLNDLRFLSDRLSTLWLSGAIPLDSEEVIRCAVKDPTDLLHGIKRRFRIIVLLTGNSLIRHVKLIG